MKELKGPLSREIICRLKAGDEVLYSGFLYTARDQAHKKIVASLNKKKSNFSWLKGNVIYYCGPTPASAASVIGSCGPTTSARMDDFSPALLKFGLLAMIGKGRRNEETRLAIKKYRAVYFVAPSGCGALLAERVRQKELVAFGELGPEAVYRLQVEDFPLLVAIDCQGRDIYGRLKKKT